jgi:arylsulfatase A-like enzyme
MFRSLCLLAAWAMLATTSSAADARPNILFVFTDDHAALAISAYGSKINKTPNIDRLAREGVLFRHCSCTNSICAPSRAVVLTGKHSHINGVIDNRVAFDGSQPHLAKLLGKAGYQTAIIGKWHLKSDPTGFDHWAVLSGAGGQGTYYNPEFKTAKGTIKPTGYATDIITDMALDWLKKRDADRPFLLMYQHKAPHRQWEPGPDHLDLYKGVTIPEPNTLFDDHAGLASPARKQEMTIEKHLSASDLKLVPPKNLAPEQLERWNAAYQEENEAFRNAKLTGKELVRWKYQRYIKDYLRCIASVDDNLGRVLEYLDKTGLANNTVVVYSSDQGFYLGDRGWYDKRWMYEESLRMPLIIRWPAVVKPGSENRDLVQNLDFAPTFLDMAGVKVPADMQGRSFLPLLRGTAPADWRKSIYYHYYEYPAVHMVQRHYGVRTDRYKLIHYYITGEWELFDLQKDPGERKSVYGDPAYSDVVKELKAELKRLRKLYRVDEFKEPPVPEKRDPKKVKTSLVLRYTFADVKKGQMSDISGNGLHGQLVKGKLVTDDGGPVVELAGDGYIRLAVTPKLDPSFRPLTIGARCFPDDRRGVAAALGGESHGFSLYLDDGVPAFAVRSAGKLTVARAAEAVPAGRWVHLMGVLDTDGRLRVWVDGKPSGDAVQGSHLTARPADALSIGADTGSLVGEYKNSRHWKGKLADVRLYWGMPGQDEVGKWVKRR